MPDRPFFGNDLRTLIKIPEYLRGVVFAWISLVLNGFLGAVDQLKAFAAHDFV